MAVQNRIRKEVETKGEVRVIGSLNSRRKQQKKNTAINFYKLETKYGWKMVTIFNVFFANVETMKPIIYSRKPKPDVRPKLKASKTVKPPDLHHAGKRRLITVAVVMF